MMEITEKRLMDRARLVPAPLTDARGRMRLATWSANVSARTEARIASQRVNLGVSPGGAGPETWITIKSNEDIVKARRTGSLLVQKMGFSGSRVTLVTTVIAELARNILLYARAGEIVLSQLDDNAQLNVKALDRGPGIENLPEVLSGGYSTSGGLGLGLSGLRRIVDEFEIKSQPGKGTQVFVSIHA